MFGINFVLRWSWVLGVALFLPVALPAGGGDVFSSESSHTQTFQPLILVDSSFCLKTSPFSNAPDLRKLDIGTPLNVLRAWQDSDGKKWLQVKISSNQMMEFSSFARRGWINI